MRIGTVCMLVTGLALGLAPAARADDPSSFRSGGDCSHLSTALVVDAQAARQVVPDPFTVLEPIPGKAVLALVTQDCTTSVDGGPPSRAFVSVAFIFVDPIRSPAGCETYDLFWTTSRNDPWHRAMQDIGVETGLVRQSSLNLSPGVAGVDGLATNPYWAAPYSYTATATDTVVGPGPLPSVHCHLGARGLVRASFDHRFTGGGGVAQVQLGPSPLWERLGARPATSAALLARFTWTGLTEIVSSPLA